MSFSNLEKRDLIMEHYLNPKFKTFDLENRVIKHGESCADYLEFDFKIKDKKIENLRFNGQGCAFFIASTDMLCEEINGLTISEFICFIDKYEKLIYGKIKEESEIKELGKLAVFENVKKHFNRLDCVQMLSKPLKEIIERLKNNEK